MKVSDILPNPENKYILLVYMERNSPMETAKLFQNGNSQAVRLPKEFRFESGRVYVKKMGNAVILLPYGAPWQSMVDSLSLFSSDFMQERTQLPAQKRADAFS
jgi:antitoxin VapB